LALEYCQKGLKLETEEVIQKVLKLKMELINKSDAGCHAVAEVTGKEFPKGKKLSIWI